MPNQGRSAFEFLKTAVFQDLLRQTSAGDEAVYKFFDALPVGISFSADTSCQEIRHNAKAAAFLRTTAWSNYSHSNPVPPPFKVLREGKVLLPEEMPVQRAVWRGEEIDKDELEFLWDDGVRRFALWSACPLRDVDGVVIGALASCEDITAQKLAELRLIESEAYYRGIFEHIQSSFALRKVIMGEDGRPVDLEYVAVNPAFEKRFGISAAAVIGKRLSEVFPGFEKDAADYIQLFGEVALTGRPKSLEAYSQAVGTLYKASVYCPEPGLVAVISDDITDKRYELLISTMQDGFAYCQMLYRDGEPEDFVYLAVNEALGRMTGLKDVVGKKVSEVVPGFREQNPEILGIYGRVAKSGGSERFEAHIKGLDQWLSVGVSSNGDGTFVTIFNDIAESKHLEQALRESSLQYRMLFDNVNDAVLLLEIEGDEKPGKFIEVNNVACRRLGYSREEFRTLSVKDISAQNENDQLRYFRKLRQEKTVTFQSVHRAKDGTLIPVEQSARYFTTGGTAYILSIARDLTERIRAERLLKTSYTRMRRHDLINKILDEENLSEQETREILTEAGLSLSGPLTCYFLQLDKWKGKSREFWTEKMEELHYLQDDAVDIFDDDPRCLAWKCSGGMGVLYSGPLAGTDVKRSQTEVAAALREKVESHVPELKVRVGVSEVAEKVTGVANQFRQCTAALQAGRKTQPGQRIHHYLDMGVLQVFPYFSDQEQIELFVERTLGKLLLYESAKNVDYLLTLEAILESSNLHDTAKRLFIHPKTLDYRKRRIEVILGVSLDSFETQLALGMALKLRKMRAGD